MTVSPHYQGSAGESYASWQLRVVDALGAETARRFRPFVRSGNVCLDFGCGGGGVLGELDVHCRIGVEPNEAARHVAAAKGIKVISSLRDADTASVDVIISNHALEHCREPFGELVEMRRVLRPNGRAVLILPLDDWRRSRNFRVNDIDHHLFAWTPLLIGNLVTEAGFEVQEASIVRHAYPRGVGMLWKLLPESLFDLICSCWSMIALKRQIRVVMRCAQNELQPETLPSSPSSCN